MRYPVEAQVSFKWKDRDGNQGQGGGTLRDISAAGAFVVTPNCPPIGADVGLRIFLRELPEATGPLRMELEGRVLRVEQTTSGKKSCGFAVLTQEAIMNENGEDTGEENSSGNEVTPASPKRTHRNA